MCRGRCCTNGSDTSLARRGPVPADFRRQVRDGNHAEASFPSTQIQKDYSCFNEGKTVYETIESISKCNYPNEKFEVIAQEPAK